MLLGLQREEGVQTQWRTEVHWEEGHSQLGDNTSVPYFWRSLFEFVSVSFGNPLEDVLGRALLPPLELCLSAGQQFGAHFLTSFHFL